MKQLKQFLLMAVMICCFTNALKAQDKDGIMEHPLGTNERADLEFFKKGSNATQTASGLLYRETTKGRGNKLAKFCKVKIKYSLGSFDGKMIVPRDNRNKIIEYQFDKLPYGVQEAIRMMPIGSVWLLGISSKLAGNKYGKLGGGKALMSYVELISVSK